MLSGGSYTALIGLTYKHWASCLHIVHISTNEYSHTHAHFDTHLYAYAHTHARKHTHMHIALLNVDLRYLFIKDIII